MIKEFLKKRRAIKKAEEATKIAKLIKISDPNNRLQMSSVLVNGEYQTTIHNIPEHYMIRGFLKKRYAKTFKNWTSEDLQRNGIVRENGKYKVTKPPKQVKAF